jgi:hypothetical protein
VAQSASREETIVIGRFAFGVGAIIAWLCTIAYAWAGIGKLRRRRAAPKSGT